jgi:glyoxylase-like metal-dependent hydrolase (beta-lactamase superfamily II)
MKKTYPFKLGKFECMVVSDGEAFVPANMLFANAPVDILNQKLSDYHLKPEKIFGPLNCLVVNTGDHWVLIDTGLGHLAKLIPNGKKGGKLLRNLKTAGIKPEDIDTVIVTHYHSDHIGGISDKKGKPTFPGAKYFFMKSEWDFACEQHDMLKAKLLSIQDRVEFLEEEAEIIPGIKAIAAPGHTPGHMMVSIYSEEKEMLYISDVIGHTLHIEFPDWCMGHEYDPKQAVHTRRAILEKAVKEKILIHAFHQDFPGLGYVVQGENGWTWQPVE